MNKRLESLDVVRGITVAGMILVNNGYSGSFQMFRHAAWNGLSVSDFVFPFFLFIMGVSMFLSFSKTGYSLTGKTFLKILKRSVLLLLVGVAINWLDMAIWGGGLNLGELRFWAVLQRIALCYFFVSIYVLALKKRFVLPMAVLLLIAYTAILILGNGYSMNPTENVLSRVDVYLFGESHLYHRSPVDPEGLLGTLSAMANVLFGFYCGMKMKDSKDLQGKIISLFSVGFVLLTISFAVNFFMPYNKRIWSPSFALVTSGACAMLFALVMRWIDLDGKRGRLSGFFQVFGVNALALYVGSELMAIIFGKVGISQFLFETFTALIPFPEFASLAYALTFVMLNYLIGYPLWRAKVFIKL